MKRRIFISKQAPFWGVLTALYVGLSVVATSFAQPGNNSSNASREQQAAEIQKQIAELNKKLADLQKPVEPTPAPTNTAQEWLKALTWRGVGPATMSGRITAISVYEADPSTFFIATASGGLLKTENNGITCEHLFDREATVSIGDVCVAPSDKNIVWVGTGENNPRNSVSYGDGVYKSTDGGKKWTNMGLKKSFQIGKVVVHPKNPNIVYVGALGRLYGPSAERGLYKTTDGGTTWERILYIDDKTGVLDIRMHPTEPETMLVATWERERDGFDSFLGEPKPPEGYDSYDPSKKWGPGTALYKTTDGGKTFKKLSKGLPTCNLGRMNFDYYRKNPNTIFLILDSEKIGMGTPPAGAANQPTNAYLGIIGDTVEGGAKLTQVVEGGPAEKAGLKADDIVQSFDGKPVPGYSQLIDMVQTKKPDEKVKVKVLRGKETKEIEVTVAERPAGQFGSFGGPGGPTRLRPYAAYYGGQRENIQDQQGPNSHEYGGVYKSTDGGESWTRINSINPRPMYFSLLRVDPTDENHLYVGGISLHRSKDGGKTFQSDGGGRTVHADHHAMWIDPRDGRHIIVGCDGGFYVTYDRMANWDHYNHHALGQFYHVAVCNKKPYWVYGGLQDNGSWGGPSICLRGSGAVNEDWVNVGGGDGFVCRVDPNDPDLVYSESQNGMMNRRNLRTGERATIRPRQPQGQPPYRFNWNTPIILSNHNPSIFYCAGDFVFRSVKKGDDLRVISPEITRTKRGSATALAESPRNPEVLWVGSDDGALWVTRDGGAKWNNVADKVGLPGPRWVATIEPSRFVEGRCYVCFDGHRSDDDASYLFVTEDFGQTWKSISATLPFGSTRCLREDVINPDLLYAGTEFGICTSLNRGGAWLKLNNNLPTVAVHEVAVHPTAGEIVAATHGRSLWILDVAPLRQMADAVATDKPFLFQPNAVVKWRSEPSKGGTPRRYNGENPQPGAQIYYALPKKAEKLTLKVVDHEGKTLRELSSNAAAGIHRVNWNLARTTAQRPNGGRGPGGGPGGAGGAGQRAGGGGGAAGGGAVGPEGFQRGGGRGGFGFFGQTVNPGMYRVVLTVDGVELSQSFRVEADPALVNSVIAEPDGDDDAVIDRSK